MLWEAAARAWRRRSRRCRVPRVSQAPWVQQSSEVGRRPRVTRCQRSPSRSSTLFPSYGQTAGARPPPKAAGPLVHGRPHRLRPGALGPTPGRPHARHGSRPWSFPGEGERTGGSLFSVSGSPWAMASRLLSGETAGWWPGCASFSGSCPAACAPCGPRGGDRRSPRSGGRCPVAAAAPGLRQSPQGSRSERPPGAQPSTSSPAAERVRKEGRNSCFSPRR